MGSLEEQERGVTHPKTPGGRPWRRYLPQVHNESSELLQDCSLKTSRGGSEDSEERGRREHFEQ